MASREFMNIKIKKKMKKSKNIDSFISGNAQNPTRGMLHQDLFRWIYRGLIYETHRAEHSTAGDLQFALLDSIWCDRMERMN